jgi:hypothetical protein
MKRIDLKSFGIGVMLSAASVLTVAAATGAGRTAVEYRIVAGQVLGGELERKLNSSAVEGWELVETVSFREQHGFAVMRRPRP